MLNDNMISMQLSDTSPLYFIQRLSQSQKTKPSRVVDLPERGIAETRLAQYIYNK
jgi:hypothetical protein